MAICSGLSFIVGLVQIVDPNRTFDLEGDSTSVWLLLQGLVALVQIPVYIFTIVFFLIWLYRANKNLTPLGASYTEFSPGWAVGWWFIPFANLVKPFQVVREVWRESDPDVQPQESGFLSSAGGAADTPAYIGFWWGLWITSNIASNIAGKVYDPDNIKTSAASGYIFMIAAIFSIAAAVLAVMIVRDITQRQELRAANIGRLREGPPPPPIFDKDL